MAEVPRAGRTAGRRDQAGWRRALAVLREFAAEHGHTYPDRDVRMPDGRSLATWTSNVRYSYHRGTLAPDRIAALEGVPDWVWRSKRTRRRLETGLRYFDSAFPRLAGWVVERGAIPAVSAVTEDGFELGRFVRNCRQHASRLTDEQRALLAALPGWSWHVTAERRATTAQRLTAARRFVAEHRYLPQPDSDDPAERDLAGWLRRYQPTLAAEFAEIRAEAVPDTWLRQYRKAVGGASDKSTVEWMSRQRAANRRGALAEPQRELFGRLAGSQERRWRERADEIGAALRRRKRPTEAALGWLTRQRHRDTAGRLSAAQSEQLAELVRQLGEFRAARPTVRCQAPGCQQRIQPPARGRTPRYCSPECRATAQTPAVRSPEARSAAALIRLVPALQRVAAGNRAGLPALAQRIQRAASCLGTGARSQRRQVPRRWHAGDAR